MASPGVGGSLSAASDVLLDNPANSQVLKRDAGYWKNLADENGSDADVRDLIVSTSISVSNATNWVSVSDLDLSDGETGQIWLCNYTLLYNATNTAGIQIRFRNASSTTIRSSTHVVSGYWQSIDVLASPNNYSNFTRIQTVRYPETSYSLSGVFGGTGADSVIKGEFRIEINGTGMTGQTLGLEIRQNSDDATATSLLSGSFATIAKVV